MYNYFMLMGIVLEEPTIEELGDDRRKAVIKLKVNRCFPNTQGEYAADVLDILFYDFMIAHIEDNIDKGMPITVKGRMQTSGQGIVLIGERIMFFNNLREPKQ
ncbi:MAG TPA: single-stranded DNA-binding protein [Candidatus Pelethenecus sp.]|nr:single-stranded DNA-binding protein [Candidatus Pelethenecus sp.]